MGFAFYHNIIDIDFHDSTDQRFEDLCHQPLISGINILEPKWHNPVAVQSVWHHEGCLLLVWLEYKDLAVLEKCIYEEEHSLSCS